MQMTFYLIFFYLFGIWCLAIVFLLDFFKDNVDLSIQALPLPPPPQEHLSIDTVPGTSKRKHGCVTFKNYWRFLIHDCYTTHVQTWGFILRR